MHLHKIFKKSNLNDAKLVMDDLVFSSNIIAANDLRLRYDFIYGHQTLKQGKSICKISAVI